MKKIIWIFIAAFIFRVFLSFLTWHGDVYNHMDWGERFWQYGPGFFYNSNVWSFTWPNQPPGTIIIFAFIRKLFELIFNLFWWVNITIPAFPSGLMLYFENNLYPALLKLPAILADLGIGYLIYVFLKNKSNKIAIIAASVFLFNPVIWYNSSLWGQTDSIVNFFSLASLLVLCQKKLKLAVFLLSISLFIKFSLVILLPVFLIVALGQKYPLKEWIKAIGISLFIIGILTIPFSGGEPFSWLISIYQKKVLGLQLPIITANAFNFWDLIFGIHAKRDTLMIGFVNIKVVGYILFFITCIPLLIKVYRKQDVETVLTASFLVVFSSFIFLTGIHERYLYPIFPILTILIFRKKDWLKWLVILSILHLINLYNFWWYPNIEFLVNFLSAGDRLIPRILGGVMTFIFIYLVFFRLRHK